MSGTHPTQNHSSYLRIDPQHQQLEMMQAAVSRIHSAAIQVSLQDDAVLLTGSVESWSGKQHAQECLRSLSGRRAIQNNLRVV